MSTFGRTRIWGRAFSLGNEREIMEAILDHQVRYVRMTRSQWLP